MAKSDKKNKKVEISKAPKLSVTGLKAPKRSETSTKQKFTASWKYPNKAFDEKEEARFEGVLVEWTIDYDSGKSKASKSKKGTEEISGTRKSFKTVRRFSGSKKTEDTFEVVRSNYYPCNSGKKTTRVRTYVVVAEKKVTKTKKDKKTKKVIKEVVTKKTEYSTKNKKWILQLSELPAVELSNLNNQVKKKKIYKKSEVVKWKDDKNPVGTVVYISKTSGKETIKVSTKNPYLYGIGVRVQGWNSKTPTKKGKKAATKSTVLWNNAAPTQAAYFSFDIPCNPQSAGATIGDATSSHKVTLTVNDHNDSANKGDTGTNANERYDSEVKLFKTTGLYSGSTFKTSPRTRVGTQYLQSSPMSWARQPVLDIGTGRSVTSLQPNEFVYYELEVINRGIAGNSTNNPSAKSPTVSCLIARPHDVSIKGIKQRGDLYEISFTRSAGDKGKRRTDTYTLQRLYNYRPEKGSSSKEVDDWSDKEWSDAANAEQDSSWTDVAVLGHGNDAKWNVQTFTDRVSNADPQPFRRTYYRVVAANSIDEMPTIVSKAVVLPGFQRIPSAKDAKIDIRSCSSAENGNAIQAIVVFNKSLYSPYEFSVGDAIPDDPKIYELNSSTGAYTETSDRTAQANKTYYVYTGYYNSNGTEMSWDTFEQAWQSSQLPSSYDFKDDQMEGYIFDVTADAKASSPALNSDKVPLGWKYTTYYIRGIQPSTKYYMKARRFLKDTETRETDSYGGYSDYTDEVGNAITVETKATPKDVKLSAPERLVYGKDLSVSWIYDSDDVQKGYQLLAYQNKPKEGEDISAAGNSVTLFQTGTKEDTAPYAVVPWENIEPWLLGSVGYEDRLYTAVRMYTEEGNWSKLSDIQETKIVRSPNATLSQVPDLSVQPLSVTFGTDDSQCAIVVRIVAHQLMGWGPTGAENVAEGSIVYSTKIVKPNWIEDSDNAGWYYYNYTFPVLPLKDAGSYTIEYTAVNDDYDLDSDVIDEDGNVVKQAADFQVNYQDVITVPQFYVVADSIDESHGGYARISILDTPEENEGCVVDLYRVTPDGAYLIYEGLDEWRNSTFTDTLPPYSRYEPCVYRLALRSSNGIVVWDDRSYAMPGYSVRFDWGDPASEEHGQYSHLTLPYNLKWSDSWTKNSRVELRLDGTYNGYWRGGVDHKNTLSTELVKLIGAEQVARVRSLAQYAGPVMVRLPNGCAFAADVQVSNLDVSYDSLTIAASFSAQEIRLPDQFGQAVVTAEPGIYKPVS